MPFQDYINLLSLQDSGNYLQAPGQANGNTVGNHENLRFIVQPIHSNSTIYDGGTGDILRTTWGSQSSHIATDYCNWLNGTAEDVIGTTVVPMQPNSPIGHPSTISGAPGFQEGPKQHLLLLITSDDDWVDANGHLMGNDPSSHYLFLLQGIFRAQAFKDTTNFENFALSVGNNSTVTTQIANNPWLFEIPSGSGTGTAPYLNHQTTGGGSTTGLLDHYVDFVPLFDPNDLTQLNPLLDNYEWEDERTGEVLHTFSLASHRFNYVGADKLVAAAFADTVSSGVPANFNSFTSDQIRSRAFITKAPIQTGTHKTQNKYIRPHIDGSYSGFMGAYDLGFSIFTSSLQEAIDLYYLTDVWNGSNDSFDHKCQSWWNLIVVDKVHGKSQHIGNVNYDIDYTTSFTGWPMDSSTQPAIDASRHLFNFTGSGGAVSINNDQVIGGGILEDANEQGELQHGISLDTEYTPENLNNGTTFVGFGGLKIYPDNTDLKPASSNHPSSDVCYNINNISVQNFDVNNQGVGQGTGPYWNSVNWDINSIIVTEDNDYIASGASRDKTNATYTGIATNTLPHNLTSTMIGDIRDQSSYTGLSVLKSHQIIAIHNASWYNPNDIENNTNATATSGPSALYYNLAGTCWQGQGTPNISSSTTNPSGCIGNPNNGSISITTDLTTLNLENCLIVWDHPAGQPTLTGANFSSGSSNHVGQWSSSIGGVNWGNGMGGAEVTGLIGGTHQATITDIVTGCNFTLYYTLTTQTGNPPVIQLIGSSNPTPCNTDGAINIDVTGGTAPYTYNWTGPGGPYTTQDISSLSSGTYNITVTEAAGCTASASYSLTANPNTLTANAAVIPPASCSVNSDITVSNINWGAGTPAWPVTVTLSDSSSNIVSPVQTVNSSVPVTWASLPDDTYIISLVDANGCTWDIYGVVNNPPVLSASYSIQLGPCGPPAQVTLTGSGGTPGYSYYYRPSGGSWILVASNVIQGLADGVYDFMIKDSVGCVAELLNITITNTTSDVLQTVSTTQVSCFGLDDGEIEFNLQDGSGTNIAAANWTIVNYISGTINIVGTTSASVYSWTISDLLAGTYDVVATNISTGCTDTFTYIISEPDVLVVTETHSDESCAPGGGDGSITLTTTGGTPGYTYSWTKDAVAIASTSNALTALTAGLFVATITDTVGCSVIIPVIILGDETEVVDLINVTAPLCAGGTDGSFEVTCANGDFPFEVWFSTDNITFLQIQAPVAGNTGLVDEFDSIDLAGLVVDSTWAETVSGTAISLPENLVFYIKLISVVNSCETATLTDTIPENANDPLVIEIIEVNDAICCDECGGSVEYMYTGGLMLYTISISTTNAATSPTDPTIWSGTSVILPMSGITLTQGNLCIGDYTITVEDSCGVVATESFIIGENPLIIEDIQYAHPYCEDCHCGSIGIVASGGSGYRSYSCNNGLHWVDTDPLSTANGPTIFSQNNYNISTVTPGVWTSVNTPQGLKPGFGQLDDGVYHIWVRDSSPCPSPAFDDMVSDCNPGGPATCVNFCTDCLSPNCYADFVDIFADHTLPTWNGGTKVNLENLSTLQVVTTDHMGPTTVGGSNGFMKFAVIEDYWWTNMRWWIEVFVYDPPTSSLSYDGNLTSATYGDVCCDIPGTGTCALDCCADMTQLAVLNANGMGPQDPNLITCSTNTCPTTNNTSWAFKLTDDTGTELCPFALPSSGGQSSGVYEYFPTQAQLGTYVEFEISNLSVAELLSSASTEAMLVVRVTNNVSSVPATSYGGLSGCWIVQASVDCDDCTAAVIDNGIVEIIEVFGAEDCECDCPPGYALDDAEYIDDGAGGFIYNENYNTCIGFDIQMANVYGQCYDVNTEIPIIGPANAVDCLNSNGVWINNWNAVTVAQNMPCCAGTLTWGQDGAKVFGDWTTGSFTIPTPIGQDVTLLPYTSMNASMPGEAEIVDALGGLLTTDVSWIQTTPVYTNRLKNIGIWPQWFSHYTNNTETHLPYDTIGITVCTEELTQQTEFILALAGADEVQFYVDGVLHIHILGSGVTGAHSLNMWNLFPIALEAGTHTLEFRGKNTFGGGPAAFAFELYPFNIGGTPTVSYLDDPTITTIDIQNITVVDYAGNPISSEHYIGEDFHTTLNNSIGVSCNPGGFVTPCGGVLRCSSTDRTDADCPECIDTLEELVGCVGNLMSPIYERIVGGMLNHQAFHDEAKIVWGVLLIKYLIKRFKNGAQTCITAEKIITWTRFLATICPDCKSNIKTIDEVNYLPDPNEGTSPINGIDGAGDINTFDF